MMIFFILLFPLTTFAISCPNNGNILNDGDSISYVLQQCGKPKSRNDYNKIIQSTLQWDYYKSTPGSVNNIKISIYFSENRVSNISVTSNNVICHDNICNSPIQNFSSTGLCGNQISVGNTPENIRSACGQPDNEINSTPIIIPMAELRYDGAGQNTLVFKDGKLVDWIF